MLGTYDDASLDLTGFYEWWQQHVVTCPDAVTWTTVSPWPED